MAFSNFSAIDTQTGKVIFYQSGTISEKAFKDTLKSLFPDIPQDNITLVIDGKILEKDGVKRPKFSGTSVVYQGVFSDLGGYSNMNREITTRLTKRGFNVKLNILKSAPQIDPDTMRTINTLASIKLEDEHSCPLIVGFTPMPVQNRGRRVIFFTMMETQGLHNEFVSRCNKYPSEIWVPCKFYIDVFKKAGIVKPLHLIPLGVNEQIYTPEAKEPRLKYREMPSGRIVEQLPNKFRFMSLFGWSHRKGPDVLCRSFLREFSQDDDACLVIYARHWGQIPEEIQGYYKELDKSAKPPTIYWCGDVVPIQDLPGCYTAADCFVFCSRGEGFGLPVCFLPGTKIWTDTGVKLIEDITQNEQVISHTGKNEKIISTMQRQYKGTIVSIRTFMHGGNLLSTPDHPFLAVRKQYKHSNDKRHLLIKPEWIPVGALKKGDLLVVPMPKPTQHNIKQIDLVKLLGLTEYDDEFVWSKYSNRPNGVTAKKIAAYSGVSQRQVYRVMQSEGRISEEKRQIVLSAMKDLHYEENNILKVKRFVTIDTELAELLGFYASEGSTGHTVTSFSFHAKEIEYHNRVKYLMKKILNIDITTERTIKNSQGHCLYFASSVGAKFLTYMLGKGALKKEMCPFIFGTNIEFKRAFLSSFQKGDGHTSVGKTCLCQEFSTSSPFLAYQTWKLLLEDGISAGLCIHNRKNKKNTEYVIRYIEERKNIQRKRSFYHKTIKGNSYFLTQILDINTLPYDGLVFNLETEKEHSYCANGIAVHNCEAGACGTPVISTYNTAMMEYLDEDVAFLVYTDELEMADERLTRITTFYQNQLFPKLGEKAIADVRRHMRFVYSHPIEANEKAERFRKKILDNYTWDKCADRVADRLRNS